MDEQEKGQRIICPSSVSLANTDTTPNNATENPVYPATLNASIANNNAIGFDNLQVTQSALGADGICGQYTNGGSQVNVAPAAQKHAQWRYIPQGLRDRAQWCVAGNDKAPRIATQGLPFAKSNDQTTWRSFDEACTYAANYGLDVGYMLSENDEYTCIDLDVKDDTPQEQLQRFDKIVECFDSYTEYSRSGRGKHVWVKGKIGKGLRRDGVEVYSQERFIICTGNVFLNKSIAPNHELLGVLKSELEGCNAAIPLADSPQLKSDDDILQIASNAKNGTKFLALLNADWETIGHSDHSKADMALIQMLAYYTQNNEQLVRLFLSSKLGQRDKATKRKDYLARTIESVRSIQATEPNAIHGEQIALQLLANQKTKHITKAISSEKLRLVTANEIAARPPMKWLVRGVLPEKGIGAIYGQPGSGKSFLVLDLLAAVSGGFLWFGIPTKSAPVVYITLEGQAGMPQRINAYRSKKGSLDRIAFIEQPIDLRDSENLNVLINLIKDNGLNGGVVCIDTLAASAPGMDENTSADMGQLIANLQEIQVQLGGFILVVHHSGKDESRGLRGWSGLNGALDCAIAVSRASDSKQDIRRRWEVSKSKDGSDGMTNDFLLEQVVLAYDEDNQPITSCVISHSIQERVPASERDDEIDSFVWQWVNEQVIQGNHPSGNSLEGERDHMQMKITQKQLRDSIARLKAAHRISTEKENGNPWLRAVDA